MSCAIVAMAPTSHERLASRYRGSVEVIMMDAEYVTSKMVSMLVREFR